MGKLDYLPTFLCYHEEIWIFSTKFMNYEEEWNGTITLLLMPSYPLRDPYIYQPCMTYTPPGKSKIGDFYKLSLLPLSVIVVTELKLTFSQF